MIIGKIKRTIKSKKNKVLWRLGNRHNGTSMHNDFDRSVVSVGKGTYGPLNIHEANPNYKLFIGNYCSIAPGVTFALSGEHDYQRISTFPFKRRILHKEKEGLSKGNITVCDDVWIGCNSTILSGVTIGQGAIIGAGSLVTKDVPPYAIAYGVPANVVKYRFSESAIEKLIQIDFSKIDYDFIMKNESLLYEKYNEEMDLSAFPKK